MEIGSQSFYNANDFLNVDADEYGFAENGYTTQSQPAGETEDTSNEFSTAENPKGVSTLDASTPTPVGTPTAMTEIETMGQPAGLAAQQVILAYAQKLGITNNSDAPLTLADLATHGDLCTYAAQIEKSLGTGASQFYRELDGAANMSGFNYGLVALDEKSATDDVNESAQSITTTQEQGSVNGNTGETTTAYTNQSYYNPTILGHLPGDATLNGDRESSDNTNPNSETTSSNQTGIHVDRQTGRAQEFGCSAQARTIQQIDEWCAELE